MANNFLHDHGIVTDENECPEVFHTWAGLSALSHIVNRRYWFDWGFLKHAYCHIYVCLVGAPGVRKSTAMDFTRRLLEEIGGFSIVPDSATLQSITQKMGADKSPCDKDFKYDGKLVKCRQIVILANELVNLINSGGNPAGMIEFFTSVWDRDKYEVETKHVGNDYIFGPYVSLLACLTTDTMKSLISSKVVTSGMLRRCVYIIGHDSTKCVPIPRVRQDQEDAKQRQIQHAKRLLASQGPLVWGQGAEDYYIAWYNGNFARRQSLKNGRVAEFLNTKPLYVIKLAMLLALSEYDYKLELTKENLRHAIELVSDVELNGPDLMNGVGRNELSPVTVEIERFIAIHPDPVKVKKIYAQFHNQANFQEIDQIISELCRIDKLITATLEEKGTKVQYVTTLENAKLLQPQKAVADSPDSRDQSA